MSMSLAEFNHHHHNHHHCNNNYSINNVGHHQPSRPPPLRTTGTYDDDEFFNSVALNLLSRYEALNLSVTEAICCTLVSPSSRRSFWDALNYRMTRSMQNSTMTDPTTLSSSSSSLSLVQRIQQTFAIELQRMIESERDSIMNKSPPIAPRHISQLAPSSSSSWEETTNKKTATNNNNSNFRKGRRFFPDCDVFFRSRKVVNLDWSLTQTIQQVQSLQLDGTETYDKDRVMSYQPPQLE